MVYCSNFAYWLEEKWKKKIISRAENLMVVSRVLAYIVVMWDDVSCIVLVWLLVPLYCLGISEGGQNGWEGLWKKVRFSIENRTYWKPFSIDNSMETWKVSPFAKLVPTGTFRFWSNRRFIIIDSSSVGWNLFEKVEVTLGLITIRDKKLPRYLEKKTTQSPDFVPKWIPSSSQREFNWKVIASE